MRCPFCSHLDTKVIDSREVGEGDQIRRRRECISCKGRFTTYESAELNLPRIIKSDNRRESFDEEKLRAGILRAVEKCPVEMERVETAISNIKNNLRAAGEREIKSIKIGNWVMEELKGLDKVAYVRFASVYRSFEDVKSFLEEIERLEHELPPELKRNQLDLEEDERSMSFREEPVKKTTASNAALKKELQFLKLSNQQLREENKKLVRKNRELKDKLDVFITHINEVIIRHK